MNTTTKKQDLANFRSTDVFVNAEIRPFQEVTGYPGRPGYEQCLISEGTIVNCVSTIYGFLPNEKFFTAVEEQLVQSDIKYSTIAINRRNAEFSVQYILEDPSFHINIKKANLAANGKVTPDTLKPMLRFINSYDGSCKTSGMFSFFRHMCTNGIHGRHNEIAFNIKHTGRILDVVMPNLQELVAKFLDNEFYSLHKKFEVLAERPIADLAGFVKFVCDKTKLFQFEKSAKNPEPSVNAQTIIETVQREAQLLGMEPNMWLGYNAFNELLHGKLKRDFSNQIATDVKLFDQVMEMAN